MATTLGIISLLIHVSQFHSYHCYQAGTNCNTEIILPDTGGTDIYTFNCNNIGDCNLKLYIGDKGTLGFNCYADSCKYMEVYVGTFDPPGSTYDASHMNNDMTATIYCYESGACQNVRLACKGNNIDCSIWADGGTIQSSTVESDTGSSSCHFDCEASGCSGTNKLLCHSGASGCQCFGGCGSVTKTNGVTWPPTSSSSTTASPTTSNPTTKVPTTANPTTTSPTTNIPTTFNPTTSNPTAAQPTTSAPTTLQPTTNIHNGCCITFNRSCKKRQSEVLSNWKIGYLDSISLHSRNLWTRELIYFSDLCSGPGGFTEYFLHINKWRCRSITNGPTTMIPTTNEPTTNEPTVDISNTGLKNGAQKSESALDAMTLLYIIIGALSGIIVLRCILFLCYRKKMKSKSHRNAEKIDMGIELGSSMSPMSTNGTKTTMEGECNQSGLAGTNSEDMHIDVQKLVVLVDLDMVQVDLDMI